MKKRPKQLNKETWEHIHVAMNELKKQLKKLESGVEMSKEITLSNMADNLHEFLEQCDGETLLDLYNEIYGTEYEDEDVEWDN